MGDISVITSKIFVAYSQCPRKAFLLLFSEDQGKPHDYPLILEERRNHNRTRYLEKFLQSHPEAKQYEAKGFKKHEFLFNVTLKSAQLEAYCAALIKVNNDPENRQNSYEPTVVVGTYSITPEQKTELFFVGLVLERIQKQSPAVGRIVTMDEKVHRVKLEKGYKGIKGYLKTLESWCSIQPNKAPALILNKYCPSCQFRDICREQAEKENNLSLLDRMTPKAIQKYNKRGIFTVQQLSYLFKPRRKRKNQKESEPIKHSLELQSLAIREQKIYIQELPDLTRQPVELFLDMEGIPDQRLYYLIGLLVCDGGKSIQHSFWADTQEDEEVIWNQFLSKLSEYPEAPIFHYGNYEIKAFRDLAKRYTTDIEKVEKHLINVNSYIYGKIYFPIFSNRLKEIGLFMDASWPLKISSGLQSLAWRYNWQETKSSMYKDDLLIYNNKDCSTLKLLVDKISEISSQGHLNQNIVPANQKQSFSTKVSEEIHGTFELILKASHEHYDRSKISFLNNRLDSEKRKRGGQKQHTAFVRIVPTKVNKIIEVLSVSECKKCGQDLLQHPQKTINKTIIDLKLTKTGCKKVIFLYKSQKSYCKFCKKYYMPEFFYKGKDLCTFGHGFKSWVVYKRVALRLPYHLIVQDSIEMFDEPISESSASNFIKDLASQYSESERILLEKILLNPFVHSDETLINIQGENQYVWTFTDGNHVIFRLTETRESDIVHKTLQGYKGVLVSDFYGGYDSLTCKQQKCWSHLIRDINDDLWKTPFDVEYESFALEIKKFILPIFKTIDRYGLKKRHLNKFKKVVDRFYSDNIYDKVFCSDLAIKYQKRFERYRGSLFTFLEYDLIPWHNNTAERALRHLAVQRKISGSFFTSGANSYLILLGIMQTCRFQEKSFLKFLMSGDKDVDAFNSPRIRKRTRAVKSMLE